MTTPSLAQEIIQKYKDALKDKRLNYLWAIEVQKQSALTDIKRLKEELGFLDLMRKNSGYDKGYLDLIIDRISFIKSELALYEKARIK